MIVVVTNADDVVPKTNKFKCKTTLKILKGKSESVTRRRTENTMSKRKSTKGQTKIYKIYT
jgi:hypothetical protein